MCPVTTDERAARGLARRRRRNLQRTGSEPEWPDPNPRARRYAEWMVAHHAMPAMQRLVLRVALRYMKADMTAAYYRASVQEIAARASLSPATVQKLLRAASQQKLWELHEGSIRPTPPWNEDAYDALVHLWNSNRAVLDHAFKGEPLTARDAALVALRDPDVLHRPMNDDEAEQAADAAEARGDEADEVGPFVSPWYWIRDLADAATFARPRNLRRRKRSDMARIKAVAFAVYLVVDSEKGRSYRWTTAKEIGQLAGYEHIERVSWALKELERAGWLHITRRKGRDGGLLFRLTFPGDASSPQGDKGCGENPHF